MPWTTVSESDIAFSATEKSAVDAARGDDTLATLITATVNEVRGYVGTKHTLGTGTTIPDSLVQTVSDLVGWRFLKTLPSKSLLTEARKQAYEDAIRRLRDVAEGRFAIEEPETASTAEVASPDPAIAAPTRYFTRTRQDGY